MASSYRLPYINIIGADPNFLKINCRLKGVANVFCSPHLFQLSSHISPDLDNIVHLVVVDQEYRPIIVHGVPNLYITTTQLNELLTGYRSNLSIAGTTAI